MRTMTNDSVSPHLESMEPLAYRFGAPGRMSSDQIRAIAVVNDGIARRLTHTLGAWLRLQVHVGLTATEPMAFSEYLRVMPEKVYVYVLRLEPFGGMALLELELPLVLALIDVLLGGKGSPSELRDVTEIEENIFSSVLSLILREMNAAWEAVGLRFAIERREAIVNVARLLEPDERALSTVFQVQVEDARGALTICLPAVVLNSIHRRLVAVNEQPRQKFQGASERVAQLMAGSRVPLVLRLPTTRLPSSALAALEPGFVLELPISRFTPAELQARGLRLRAAVPVGRGERRAAMLQPDTPTAVEQISNPVQTPALLGSGEPQGATQ